MSPYRVDARMTGRHPFEIYMLFLCFLTAVPILLGAPATPGSVRYELPPLLASLWGIGLAGGAGIALLGIYLKRRDWGLILEQVGLAITGVACLIFAGCILAYQGWDSMVGVGIVGGFGLSCARRYFQLQGIIDAAASHGQLRRNGDRP